MGGDFSEQQNKALDNVLDVFDGDALAVVKALRKRVESTLPPAPRPIDEGYANRNSDAPVLLSVKGLTKTYKIGKQKLDVLKGVSLDIKEGEFVALTGVSGSGKSTLLQLIGGLDKPTTGEVYFGDTNLAKMSDKKLSEFRRQTVGFVFQFFYLQPFLRLERNLEVPAMFANKKRQQRRERVTELAERVGLGDRLQHFPKELSGGQMQRAAIARALLNSPKILLADEPTGNLDSNNGRAIIELFESIRREFGTTIVVVTHDPEIARRADREIRLKDGLLI